TGSGSPGRLLGEKCRRLFEQLPLHPQLSDLAAQPAQLLPLAAGQPLKLALVNAVLFDPLAQRLAVEPQLSCDLGDGLVAAAHQRHRVTAELGWIDACHPEPPLDGPAANSRGVRETGSTPLLQEQVALQSQFSALLLVVGASSGGLMTAAPDRPGEGERRVDRWAPDQAGQQPTQLGDGERDQHAQRGHHDHPPSPSSASGRRARVTARNASATRARVTCRYQAGCWRTWSWSSPTSSLACSKASSTRHRQPATRTRGTSEVSAGAKQT